MAAYSQNFCVNPRELVNSQPQLPDITSFACADLYYPPPTPQSIINGEYRGPVPRTMRVEYVLQNPKYRLESPSLSIHFTVKGNVGPCLLAVLREQVIIDGADNTVFEDCRWNRTKWVLDWPGLEMDCIGLWCHDVNGKPLTRDALIREIGAQIGQIMRKSKAGDPKYRQSIHTPPCWRIENIDFRDIRLVSLNYHSGVWVPTLAVTRHQ
ncbi:hypothetical protein ARMGADRAFT_1165894 [Armillaria gallica]|uniref:Uncharacterized protein n=1 Tax=Armillaria gallica TaxID=47427 RepID=A0A2H3DDH0_ARMGA|nr:hypothetical protein ARMGADRAFT_1165894 [Armillaria gallica]